MSVAILGCGDMGSSVARCLVDKGLRVTTCLAGRSERSRQLAADAGIEDTASLQALVSDAGMLLSIMPPASAHEFAVQVCPLIQASGKDVLFVDCNAVSPQTLDGISRVAETHSVRFHDIGIVGASPRPGRKPVRFYSSGRFGDTIEQLATDLIDIRELGDETGRASALKMIYASLTKGTNALRAAALIAGEAYGVGKEIRAEWKYSLPDAYESMEARMSYFPSAAGRWAGEMREIAETYRAIGMTPSFHEGAEWIYELLASTASSVSADQDIEQAVAAFMAALDKKKSA